MNTTVMIDYQEYQEMKEELESFRLCEKRIAEKYPDVKIIWYDAVSDSIDLIHFEGNLTDREIGDEIIQCFYDTKRVHEENRELRKRIYFLENRGLWDRICKKGAEK